VFLRRAKRKVGQVLAPVATGRGNATEKRAKSRLVKLKGRDYFADRRPRTRQDLKRRKTGSSGSSESPPIANTGLLEGDSDNEGNNGRSTGPSKRSRARVAEGRRDKDTRDKEREREREKAEAAGRRKGRAERRHVEGEHRETRSLGNPTLDAQLFYRIRTSGEREDAKYLGQGGYKHKQVCKATGIHQSASWATSCHSSSDNIAQEKRQTSS